MDTPICRCAALCASLQRLVFCCVFLSRPVLMRFICFKKRPRVFFRALGPGKKAARCVHYLLPNGAGFRLLPSLMTSQLIWGDLLGGFRVCITWVYMPVGTGHWALWRDCGGRAISLVCRLPSLSLQSRPCSRADAPATRVLQPKLTGA